MSKHTNQSLNYSPMVHYNGTWATEMEEDDVQINHTPYEDYITDYPIKPKFGKCIVLDLDETLVHTERDNETDVEAMFSNSNYPQLRKQIYQVQTSTGPLWGVMRPELEVFLKFCFEYFDIVAIWSAGKPEYVNNVLDIICPIGYKFHIIYTSQQTKKTFDGTQYKPLISMIDDPNTQGIMTYDNTYFVDDREDNFMYGGEENAIIIPEFLPKTPLDALYDDTLPTLMAWFYSQPVFDSDNVWELDKSLIFQQNP